MLFGNILLCGHVRRLFQSRRASWRSGGTTPFGVRQFSVLSGCSSRHSCGTIPSGGGQFWGLSGCSYGGDCIVYIKKLEDAAVVAYFARGKIKSVWRRMKQNPSIARKRRRDHLGYLLNYGG